MTKAFMACIYLYRGYAVKSLRDQTIIETDPVRLAGQYSERGADALFIYDLTEGDTDQEHEATLDTIKEICAQLSIPVMAGGHIERAEDVKKLFYAGCREVILDFEKDSNRQMIREQSLRFGKERIFVLCDKPDILEQYGRLAEEYACGLLLRSPHYIRENQALGNMPFYVHINQLALNKLIEIMANENLLGVTGNVINDNLSELPALKELCKEAGIEVREQSKALDWEAFKQNGDGLVPVVVQDYRTQEVLMVAYMDRQAYEMTLSTGKMTYFSRSRQTLWVKGDTSGHYQYVRELRADCDMDTLLARVQQIGPACHTGAKSCFFNEIINRRDGENTNPLRVFEDVYDLIRDRQLHPKEGSYTNYLFDKGLDKILKKMGEEATEIVIAAKNPNPNEIKYEISDFLYHMMVLMAEKGITWEDITTELANR